MGETDLFAWDVALALLGVMVPVVAALYEFLIIGRKRLGYRVQMDTTATDEVHSQYAWALQELQSDGTRLVDPSFVLLRIENLGTTHIDTSDYAVLDDNKVGISVTFPGRRVAGMVVSELSDDFLRPSFAADSGLGVQGSTVNLPKVPLNRGAHYKVLAALERAEEPDDGGNGDDGNGGGNGGGNGNRNGGGNRGGAGNGRRTVFPPPDIVGGVKGGVGRGRILETHSRTGVSKQSVALVCFLVAVILGQLLTTRGAEGEAAPLDCATGELRIVGSTAFEPVLTQAAEAYQETCPGSRITVDTHGSAAGLEELNAAGAEAAAAAAADGSDGAGGSDGSGGLEGSDGSGGSDGEPDGEQVGDADAAPPLLAFSDGPKGEEYPQLLPRPLAFSLFTLVISEEAGVQDLSLTQIRDLYAGRIGNWAEVGGHDVDVRIVSRHSDSGTRRTFQERILDGQRELGDTSDNCRELDPGSDGNQVRCRRDSTGDLLATVAQTPGAIGYAEVGAASDREDLLRLRIDGQPATLEGADHGAYPFWETEYAYTYGEPAADSLTASYLRYLTNEVGKDIVRAHGHRPCAELQNPVLCRPTAEGEGQG